jgi:hypothetical protein
MAAVRPFVDLDWPLVLAWEALENSEILESVRAG